MPKLLCLLNTMIFNEHELLSLAMKGWAYDFLNNTKITIDELNKL